MVASVETQINELCNEKSNAGSQGAAKGNDVDTAQKMKFSIRDFFSKCEQIRSFLRIWSH